MVEKILVVVVEDVDVIGDEATVIVPGTVTISVSSVVMAVRLVL